MLRLEHFPSRNASDICFTARELNVEDGNEFVVTIELLVEDFELFEFVRFEWHENLAIPLVRYIGTKEAMFKISLKEYYLEKCNN